MILARYPLEKNHTTMQTLDVMSKLRTLIIMYTVLFQSSETIGKYNSIDDQNSIKTANFFK